ncbi:MAG TPA: hypothetical protein VEH81_02810, partial [Ktedonobacteraceae bacterium]|nr:hypothetical protein [Ktedonobacteraceae bacterium]
YGRPLWVGYTPRLIDTIVLSQSPPTSPLATPPQTTYNTTNDTKHPAPKHIKTRSRNVSVLLCLNTWYLEM